MHYLKESKKLFYVAAVLPVFFLYLDKSIVLWLKGFYNGLQIHRFFVSLDPLINVAGNGATLMAGALVLYVAPAAPPWRRAEVLLDALRRLPHGDIWLPPEIRSMLRR